MKLKDSIKNLLVGFYNPANDKITAKENTLTYYHEEGHRAWFNKGIESMIQSYSWIIIVVALAAAGSFTKDVFVKIILLLPLLALIVSELHAWYFALSKYRRLKNDKVKYKVSTADNTA